MAERQVGAKPKWVMRFRAVDRTTLERAYPRRLQRFERHFGPPARWSKRQWEAAAHRVADEATALASSRRYLRQRSNSGLRKEDEKRYAKKLAQLGADAKQKENRAAKSKALQLYSERSWKSKGQAARTIAPHVSKAISTVRRWLRHRPT